MLKTENRLLLGRGRFLFLHVLQKLFDPFDVRLRKIQGKVQLRHATQLEPFDEFAPDVARSVFQSFDGVRSFSSPASIALIS